MILLQVLLAICFAVMVWQDYKNREISILFLLVGFGLLLCYNLMHNGLRLGLQFMAINMVLTIVQLAGVFLYFFIRKKKNAHIIDRYIGKGDIVFFIVLCAGFSPLNYFAFLQICFVTILILSAFQHIFSPAKFRTIPLAGNLALAYIVILILTGSLFEYSLYSDVFILQLLSKFYM